MQTLVAAAPGATRVRCARQAKAGSAHRGQPPLHRLPGIVAPLQFVGMALGVDQGRHQRQAELRAPTDSPFDS